MFNRKLHRGIILLHVVLGVAIAGCKDNSGPGSDPKIAAAANAANAGEIQVGQLAQAMAFSPAVKSFAARMVNEHTAAQQRQAMLFSRLGIVPEDDATSLQLQADARGMSDTLRMRSGSDFDLAYIDGQIAMHMKVLDLLNKSLIPAVRQAELRADLGMMSNDVSTHLQAAKSLRIVLGNDDSDGGLPDGSVGDGGASDGGASDGGRIDGGASDGGRIDGGASDGGRTDGGRADGGSGDGGMMVRMAKAVR